MISRPPIEWNDPATWPWMIWVWIAFALASFIKPAWTWLQRRRGGAWPIADGRISSTGVNMPSSPWGWKQAQYFAELDYTYTVAGAEYSGTYRRECATEREAEEFIRDLESRPVNVHVHPTAPDRSRLLESDIQSLLANRPPTPASSEEAPVSLPLGHGALVLFQALSLIGLLLSLWVHIGAVLGKLVAPDFFFWGLHVGIFVVWFPAIFVARGLVGNLQRKDLWKVVLKGSPEWVRYMLYGFLTYAFVNFALFMLHAPPGDHRPNPPVEDWRGFSGHWMAFYFSAFAILNSAARRAANWSECPNGHRAPHDNFFCPQCGLRIDRRGSA